MRETDSKEEEVGGGSTRRVPLKEQAPETTKLDEAVAPVGCDNWIVAPLETMKFPVIKVRENGLVRNFFLIN